MSVGSGSWCSERVGGLEELNGVSRPSVLQHLIKIVRTCCRGSSFAGLRKSPVAVLMTLTLNYALLPGVLICGLEEEPGGSADDSC